MLHDLCLKYFFLLALKYASLLLDTFYFAPADFGGRWRWMLVFHQLQQGGCSLDYTGKKNDVRISSLMFISRPAVIQRNLSPWYHQKRGRQCRWAWQWGPACTNTKGPHKAFQVCSKAHAQGIRQEARRESTLLLIWIHTKKKQNKTTQPRWKMMSYWQTNVYLAPWFIESVCACFLRNTWSLLITLDDSNLLCGQMCTL